MADQSNPDVVAASDDGEALTGVPRWVKMSAVVAVLVVLMVVFVLATGGAGEHGPGRHSGGDDKAPSSAVPAQPGEPGHQPPPGAHGP